MGASAATWIPVATTALGAMGGKESSKAPQGTSMEQTAPPQELGGWQALTDQLNLHSQSFDPSRSYRPGNMYSTPFFEGILDKSSVGGLDPTAGKGGGSRPPVDGPPVGGGPFGPPRSDPYQEPPPGFDPQMPEGGIETGGQVMGPGGETPGIGSGWQMPAPFQGGDNGGWSDGLGFQGDAVAGGPQVQPPGLSGSEFLDFLLGGKGGKGGNPDATESTGTFTTTT